MSRALADALALALPLAALAGLLTLLARAMDAYPAVAEAVAPWIR